MNKLLTELRGLLLVFARFVRYFLYRLGLARRPEIRDIAAETFDALALVLGWRGKIRSLGREHFPAHGPAIVVSNHIKLDDPFFSFHEAFEASRRELKPWIMMRDDFFEGSPLKSKLIDMDEIASIAGGIAINREQVRLSQLKPFVNLLKEAQCFVMYPGRTRSRSGLVFEFRDGIDELGSAAFFAAQVEQLVPGVQAPIVPLTRTYNPATRQTAMVMGEPLYLPPNAKRIAQRDADMRLAERIGENVEIHAGHIISGLLYLRCLHGMDATVSRKTLLSHLTSIRDRLTRCRVCPRLKEAPRQEMNSMLRFLHKEGALQSRGETIIVNRDRVLSCPVLDNTYLAHNPIKYMLNQILHMEHVTSAIEHAILGG